MATAAKQANQQVIAALSGGLDSSFLLQAAKRGVDVERTSVAIDVALSPAQAGPNTPKLSRVAAEPVRRGLSELAISVRDDRSGQIQIRKHEHMVKGETNE